MKARNQRVKYGPFQPIANPGVPADHFTPAPKVSSRQLRKTIKKIDREIARRAAKAAE